MHMHVSPTVARKEDRIKRWTARWAALRRSAPWPDERRTAPTRRGGTPSRRADGPRPPERVPRRRLGGAGGASGRRAGGFAHLSGDAAQLVERQERVRPGLGAFPEGHGDGKPLESLGRERDHPHAAVISDTDADEPGPLQKRDGAAQRRLVRERGAAESAEKIGRAHV